jgi:hypothetical protein
MSQSSHSGTRPSGVTSILWALLSFALFGLVTRIWVSKTDSGDVVTAERSEKRIQLRKKVDQEDTDRLTKVAWIDKGKGIVHLPVARAKELALQELGARRPVASSVALDPVLPMPAAYDPKAVEPQPPALPSSPQGSDTIRFASAPLDTPVQPGGGQKGDGAPPAQTSDAPPAKSPEPLSPN